MHRHFRKSCKTQSSRATAALAAALCMAFQAMSVPAAWADGDHRHTKTAIKHLVIVFQENQTFDHYFGTYPNAANGPGEPRFVARDDTPAVNGIAAGITTSNNNKTQPFRLGRDHAFTCSQNHGYGAEQKAVNSGLLDKFVESTSGKSTGCEPDGTTVMGYFDGNTVTALWNYAQNFAMSDNSFGTTFGPSTPGAINLVSGQTHGASAFTFTAPGVFVPKTTGNVFVAADGTGTDIGDLDAFQDDCGVDQGGTRTGQTTLLMSGPNVGDLLNAKGVTWGWFQGGFAPTQPATLNPDGSTATPAVCGSTHAGHPNVPNPTGAENPTGADIHGPVTDYSSHHQPFMYYASTRNPHHLRPSSVQMIGKSDQANHQYDISDFFDALKARNLPAVSFIKAASFQDGHPGNSDPLTEQTFLVQLLNTLQQSDQWEDTAVVIAYDDSDGWYDHVNGPIVNPSSGTGIDFFAAGTNCGTPPTGAFQGRCGYGPRLPLVVVSPWARENFVDHATTDQSSILRFIEDNWSLGFIDGPVAPAKGQTSYDRLAGSIESMFDFDRRSERRRPLILDEITGEIVSGGSDLHRRY